jgi:hypothetical protein
MAIQDFTAGQILTAAQMDSLQANDYNQTVSTKTVSYTLVAADKGTRVVMNAAGATTITVNTSLFTAGDTLQLQNIGAGVTTVTAGTATVSSAGPLAIPQYGSGTLYFTSAGVSIFFPSAVTIPPASSGLTLITNTSFSAVSSFTLANSTFTSTYKTYAFCASGTGGTGQLSLQVRSSGTTATTSYYSTNQSTLFNGSNSARYSNNASAFNICELDATFQFYFILQTGFGQTGFAYVSGQAMSDNTSGSSCFGGRHAVSQNNDSLIMTAASGTMTGTYQVYGMAL